MTTAPQQSPIFLKTETFMLWLMEHTRKFPKHERFRLQKWMDDAIHVFHQCITRAAQSSPARPHLMEADIQLDLLRSYLRMAMELGYTSHSQFGFAAQQTSEIGKLLGGWLKTA